jgi:hypothetical protein
MTPFGTWTRSSDFAEKTPHSVGDQKMSDNKSRKREGRLPATALSKPGDLRARSNRPSAKKAPLVLERYRLRHNDLGLTISAIRTRSAKVRAPILRIAAPR